MIKKYRWILIYLGAPLITLAVAIPTLAETGSSSTSDSQRAGALRKAAETEKAKLEKDKNRLKEDKLKLCRVREAHIDNIMGRIASRGQNRYNVITTAAERTEKFYTEKGKILSNYDALLATVNTKKVAAQAAIDEVKAAKTDFKCDGSDPKGAAASFKTKVQDMDSSLKDYRTAVKNLIVGVKSVQGTASSGGSH